MQRIFEGLTVLDCASFIAAPAAATILADFGADVIKIEPPAGDPFRHLPQLPGNPRSEHNWAWILESRNKQGLALDLGKAEGRAVLYRMVPRADVFITNFPPAVRKRLGINYKEIAPLNPLLIYASFTGYGENGREANKPGFDSNAWWARSGMMDLVRPDHCGPPARSLPGMGDHPSALALFGAIVDEVFAQKELADWRAILDSRGLIFGVVAEVDELPSDEQMLENDALIPFQDDDMLTINSPIWIEGEQKVAPRPPPEIGQDS